jgi:hypothetical protein
LAHCVREAAELIVTTEEEEEESKGCFNPKLIARR